MSARNMQTRALHVLKHLHHFDVNVEDRDAVRRALIERTPLRLKNCGLKTYRYLCDQFDVPYRRGPQMLQSGGYSAATIEHAIVVLERSGYVITKVGV